MYIPTEQNDYARRLKTGEFYTPPYLSQDSAGWLLECLTLAPKQAPIDDGFTLAGACWFALKVVLIVAIFVKVLPAFWAK